MRCPNCNTENENVAFCISCGTPLETENKPNPEKKFNEEDLINPSVVEKKEIEPSFDNIFGTQEEYTVRSNDKYNDVLNIYEKKEQTETLDYQPNKKEEQVPIQDLIDTVADEIKKDETNDNNVISQNDEFITYEVSNTPKDNEVGKIEEKQEENKNMLQNPVSEEKEIVIDEKVNLFKLIKLMFGSFFRPGTTIKENTRHYTKSNASTKIYIFFSTLTFIAFLISNLINSCFVKIYDINIGTYTTTFSLEAIKNTDYLNIALIGILLTFGVTLLITTIYYIASFITNKGLSFGRYLAVITLCLLPFYLGTCIIGPLISIPSYYFGVAINLFGIVYSFIILITILNDMLTFKNTNQKIIYHTIILSIAFTITGIVVCIFLKDLLTTLKLVL